MKYLESYLRPTQPELYAQLRKMFPSNISCKGKYILVKGEAPVLLVAHLDTVHKKPVNTICTSQDGNILMSPEGIGGDDRCGVYALVAVHAQSAVKPWLLFTCDEEIGGVGASAFCAMFKKKKLPKALSSLKMIVEIDRKGQNDAVYYDCGNDEFEAYITSKGFVTAYGTFSDISFIAPELGVAAVNLSSGYYDAHTQHEAINRAHLENTIKRVLEIVKDASNPEFPKYAYIEAPASFDEWGWAGYFRDYYGDAKVTQTVGKKKRACYIPSAEYAAIYMDLLDVFCEEELEEYVDMYGEYVLEELWENEIGRFLGCESDSEEETEAPA